ncbi:DNA-directed RNA polymerase II subunit rpb7 [Aspergillus udagawae]|uniref:DNA-directed RNA polymerase II subunit rpb7 n=1 Tax=Aspergillus udagawae TaxID=91492 RepID=A0A8H3RV77_9EURO|nr:DNA-directed RNA polymerase II subunit rpb7 [Aspergillus udagawae]GFF38991.1 DNA-directed RNA polymerase II subunit rpb7 [Aspergillus udagawae]GFF73439.1 DNA-directed RNA polymerase II subunit rpb7 [Aspergillus udagawae]GFG04839.1 DNA-directed RNA polymerase II subunit rpb7 [Aspergillus udagawae]GFG26187.1 DNA-directed RNA polymerase II subunit rpb7 [Aspergillus udagawae]
MSLKDLYQRFLANPKSVPLAANASLIYVTTATQFDGADAIVSHLTKQETVVKKKSADIIGAIEGSDSLCLDVEVTLEFVSGGGAYLPSLDDNFLADRVASFPTVHIVRFDSENQIQNVRIYWDQASLLKQVDVIGARGRGWPIRDAKDQTRLIKAAVACAPASKGPASSQASKKENSEEIRSKSASPSKRYIKDPYAAESLEELLSPGKDRAQPVRAPRAPASAKPPPRDYSELFVGDDENDAPEATPSKSRAIAPKAGAGKNYRASRIFEDDEAAAAEAKQQIAYKTNPKRFDHFELGADNSEREVKSKPGRPMSRHVPHWDFEDFETPEKPKRQPRPQEARHFGWSDDEVQPTPPVKPFVVQPRRDAETHFDLRDKDDEEHKSRIISSFQNKGLNLYKTHMYNEEESPGKNAVEKAPLGVVPNGGNRKKDFETHWSMTGSSPADGKVSHENQKPMGTDRLMAVKMMESSWEAYDESPQPSKTAPPPQRRALRHVNEKHWGFGDEE